MESSPSLLEEDDFLLDEVSKHGDSVHQQKPSCSSPKDSSNKENINLNKSEAPKLSVEPLQMKRKKKCGGYNLRKSLAWDRAFFTEEGVLDPIELSMLTGTYANFAGEELSVISEEGTGLISNHCQSINNSPKLQSHEKKKASDKVSTSHGGSGTGLNSSGCPRPSPSSSLKRPATLNAGRFVTNEFKFPKTAIPKPGPCSVSVTAKRTMPRGGSSKHNQMVRSVIKIQKGAESKIPTNVKHMPKVKAESGMAAMPVKSSTKLPKANSSVKIPSSTNVCSQLVSKADDTCLKEIRKNVVPLGKSHSKEDGHTLVIASAHQNISIASSSVHGERIQARKPSGLRMPSPSLGYFGQPKPSVSNNLAPTSSRFITPGLFRDRRPSQAPGEKPKMLHDIMASVNSGLLSSRKGCSATSDFNAVSHSISKPALEKNTKKSTVTFPNDSKHVKITSDEIAAHEFHEVNKKSEDHVQHDRHGSFVLKEDSHHQTRIIRLLQNTQVCEDLMESDDIKNDFHGIRGSEDSNNSVLADCPSVSQKTFAVEDLLTGENLCNSPVSNFGMLKSGVKEKGRKQNSLLTQVHKEISERSFYRSPTEQTQEAKFSPWKGESLPNGDKPLPKTNHKSMSDLAEEAHFYGSTVIGYREANTSESCDSERENSHHLSREKAADSSIEAFTRDEMTKSTHVKERQSHDSIGILSEECCKNYLNPQAKASDLSEQPEGHLEAESICLAVEQRCDSNHVLHAGLLLEKGYPHVKVMEVIPSIVPDGGQVYSSIDRVYQAPGEDDHDIDRQISLNDQRPEPVDTAPSVDKTGCLADIKLNCDIFLNSEAVALGFHSSLSGKPELIDAGIQELSNHKQMHNMSIDGLNTVLAVEELRCQNLTDSLHKESHNMEMDGSCFSRKRVPDESQEFCLPNSKLIARDHSEGELKSSMILTNSINVVPDIAEHKGEESLQSIIGNVPADCCIRQASLVHDYEKSEQQELAKPHLAATTGFRSNNRVQMKEHHLIGQCSISGRSTEENISSFGGTLPQKADVTNCGSESSSDVTQVLCSLEETCKDLNKFDTDSSFENKRSDFVCLEDAQSDSIIIAPLPEDCGLLTETRIKCGIELRKEAKSSEFSSDLRIDEDNEICVKSSSAKDRQSDLVCIEDAQSDPVIAAALPEAYGLLTETHKQHDMQLGKEAKLLTGQNLLRSQEDFDGLKKSTLAYEDENKGPHEDDTSAGELHYELNNAPLSELDNASCPIADNGTIGPSKNSDKDLKKGNMQIALPRGVVPFSEEWLAAIEAAGEDILTLKTGAVQNSPPDRSLPEPSPWSPVRRRNNQIGPYDCTKFTNTAPSDSQ